MPLRVAKISKMHFRRRGGEVITGDNELLGLVVESGKLVTDFSKGLCKLDVGKSSQRRELKW